MSTRGKAFQTYDQKQNNAYRLQTLRHQAQSLKRGLSGIEGQEEGGSEGVYQPALGLTSSLSPFTHRTRNILQQNLSIPYIQLISKAGDVCIQRPSQDN